MDNFTKISLVSTGVIILLAGAGCNGLANKENEAIKNDVRTSTVISTSGPYTVYIDETFDESPSGVYIVNKDGSEERITAIDARGAASFVLAELSPNNEFVFYGYGIGDGYHGFIYEIATKKTYKIPQFISGITEAGWLSDGRLQFYRGCIVHGDCDFYQSVNATAPWKTKFVKKI